MNDKIKDPIITNFEIDARPGEPVEYKASFIGKKPGMFQSSNEAGAMILILLAGVALGFLITILLCSSCAGDPDPYNNIDAMSIALHDEIILRELRKQFDDLDSSRVRKFNINDAGMAEIMFHNDTIESGTSGKASVRKMPPDSVYLMRRDGILWAVWCKHWFKRNLDFKDTEQWIIDNHILRNGDSL